MDEQMKWLVEIQKFDSRLMELQRLRKELPVEMERISEEIRMERERFQRAQEQLEALKPQRRRREKDLEVEVERVKKSQSRLFEAKTNKEYQALLKEIELAKEANSGLEEEILLLMEEMDQRAKELKGMEEGLRLVEQQLTSRQTAISSQLGGLESEEPQLQAKREQIAARIEPSWMVAYNRVARGHAGLAVVRVDGGTCQGCFVSIQPQLYNEILRSGPIVQCPFCSRFIYHEAVQETDGAAGPEK